MDLNPRSALQTEYIARAILKTLQEKLAPMLLNVEARWADVEAFPLPEPATVTLGFKENVLDLLIDQFPRIAVIGAPRSPDPNEGSLIVAEANHAVLVEWQILGATEYEATVMAWRYGEAILEVLLKNAPYAGFDATTITPPVDEGQASSLRQPGSTNTASPGLVGGGSTTLILRGGYSR